MIKVTRMVAAAGMLLLAVGMMMASTGCAGNAKAAPTNLRAGVHPDATLVSSGAAPSFSSTEPGRIYVYDATDNVRLGIYTLRKNQQFVLDPKSGRATIDGNEVVIEDVNNGHQFQIYYESDSSSAAGSSGSSETDIDRSITVYKEDSDATRKANESR